MATLLTGVGYIGAALLRRLHERGEPVVAIDNGFSTQLEAIRAMLATTDAAELVEGDIADPRIVASAFDRFGHTRSTPPTVFHLAAQPSAAIANADPDTTERSNLVGARVLLQAARDRGARVVFGGSFRVYGDDLLGTTVDELTPYGKVGDLSHLSKVYVEQLARMMGVAFVSVRLGVTYGLSPIMKTTPTLMTVPNLFCQRAARGEVLNVLEDRPVAFIHVDDAVDALLLAADQLDTGWHVLNAAPEVATIGQVARTVQRVAQARGGEVRIHGAAASEASFSVSTRLTGFTPRHTLASGLPAVCDYFRTQT